MDETGEYQIELISEREAWTKYTDALGEVIRTALHAHEVRQAQISVALVDDARIAALNERFLGHRGATDVITFDGREDGAAAIPGAPPSALDGEIVMAVETAVREAAARGHTVEQELALYAVHGVLHLLGYDDADLADADRMHAREDEILTTAGLGRVFAAVVPQP